MTRIPKQLKRHIDELWNAVEFGETCRGVERLYLGTVKKACGMSGRWDVFDRAIECVEESVTEIIVTHTLGLHVALDQEFRV